MNIKKYCRFLSHPLVVELYHRLRPQRPWEGVYPDFSEVAVTGEGLESDLYADLVERKTREVAEELTKGETVPVVL
jgi:hypothetical protein